VTTLDSDKRNDVVFISQNWLERDETRGRKRQSSNAEIPNISELISMHQLLVETRCNFFYRP
jgi:hypothetical protein